MSPTNMFVEKETAERALFRAVEKLDDNLDKIKLAINQNRTYLQENSYQLLVNIMSPENPWERMLYSELLLACFQLELKCHGTSAYFLKAFLSFARQLMQQHENKPSYSSLVEHNQEEGERYLKYLVQRCRPSTPACVNELIRSMSQEDPSAGSASSEAISLAGLEGTVVVEEGDGQALTVELQFGYNFPVDTFRGFVTDFGTVTKTDVKVLLVDGMIESVSEMDKVFRRCYETKLPLMIVAQSFSEEVIATIYSNTTRGGFDVLPVKLQQSLEALNMLNDIAVVAGGDVVSTLKGEQLGFVDFDALPSVHKVSITNKTLTVLNNSTRNKVLGHLAYLEQRRKDQSQATASITDLGDLTSKRVNNLLSHLVRITVPKSTAAAQKPMIDNILRGVRSVLTTGVVDPRDLDLGEMSRMWKLMHADMVRAVKPSTLAVPTTAFWLAGSMAANLASLYFTSAGVIVQS